MDCQLDHEDRLWIKTNDIMCKVSSLVPTGKSERMFRIDTTDQDKILKCLKITYNAYEATPLKTVKH